MSRKWTAEQKAEQSLRLKRSWSDRRKREEHSSAMKKHWEERKQRLPQAPRLSSRDHADRRSAINSLLSLKESVERQVGTSLSVSQIADIVCLHYARNHNVQTKKHGG